MNTIQKFVRDQLSCWPLACANFRALKNVETKTVNVGGLDVILQHNPARVISSAAKLDPESVAKRKCFLCNRFPEQTSLRFDGRKGKKYDILLNPYPIFPEHLVIAMAQHCDQSIWKRFVDILDLSRKYHGYTFFYNGPHSGASAPDHHHFQAAPSGLMPLENAIKEGKSAAVVTSMQDAVLYRFTKYLNGIFIIKAQTSKSMAKMFYRLLDCAGTAENEPEPLINLFSWYEGNEYTTAVVFRRSHRSHHYFSEGPDHLTMSPGCADMGGYLIVPVKEDFDKLDDSLAEELLREVTISEEEQNLIIWRLTRSQTHIHVGIMSAKELEFEIVTDGAGVRKARWTEGKIEYDGALYDELFFEEQTLSTMFAEPTFILHNVVIGKDFHWERTENQSFAGALRIIVEDDHLTAVNIVGIEDYMLSVISSEMSATSSEEFLKAHAVISRSWALYQKQKHRAGKKVKVSPDITNLPSLVTRLDSEFNHDKAALAEGGEYEYVRWYDNNDHSRYDVCADDHCQRYQGLTRATGKTVKKAVDSTWGQILSYRGELCDARFSKCCGGMSEVFSTCWDDMEKPYLQALPDTEAHSGHGTPYCKSPSAEVISQVLNNYDRETDDFYEWTETYGTDDLSDIVREKSGIDIGRIKAIEAVEKGPSGRISKIRISGDKLQLTVGKELEIRRLLSRSHLKSSAFTAHFEDDGNRIVLNGKGWGHGVGMCQIGAAVMASEGKDYRQILEHYYPGAEVTEYKK